MENSFKEGAFVCSNDLLQRKLQIRRYIPDIYYCRIVDKPDEKEVVYFERELMEYKETKQGKE